MGGMTLIKRSSLYRDLIILGCVLCNLTQIPTLYNNRILSLGYSGAWFLLLIVMILHDHRIKIQYFIIPVFFDIYCIILSLGKGGYTSSDLFRPINLCTFILLIGILAGRFLDEANLQKISGAFILSALIVAIYLYFDIFRGLDWAGTGGYLYGAKNSAGQIFLTAIILLILFFMERYKIISIVLCSIFCALIIMMKSRSTLLTLVLITVYIVLFVIKKPLYKAIGMCVISIIAIIILTDDSLYNLYVNQIMLNNKDINDFSAITSDRDIHYEFFARYFGQYWVVGTGGTYLEAMPLAVLMSYGIVGGIPVLLYSLFPLYVGIKNINKRKDYRIFCHIIISLGIVMWVNGIFEEQSPFGPGAKCYFLWLVTGIFIGYKEKKKKKEMERYE